MADANQSLEMGTSILSNTEIDAIGEILNISMGSAATAISALLDKHVDITTPQVEVHKFHDVSYAELEPAIMVKIEYVEGLSGNNVMVFRQSDMQIILNLLMGSDEPPTDDFIFDEMSTSAACEVMNQMMGASATALSNFLGKTVNISIPTAVVMDNQNTFESYMGLGADENIISVSFNIDIDGVMNSEFISVMTCNLAKDLVGQVMPKEEENPAVAVQAQATSVPPVVHPQPSQGAGTMPSPEIQAASQIPSTSSQAASQMNTQPQISQMPSQQPMGYPFQEWGGMPPPYGYYPAYPGYPPIPPQGPPAVLRPQEVNVQIPKFPSFDGQGAPVSGSPLVSGNMELMMNVPLNVSVEIGKTKRKIREIIDFTQGTVIELEKQAGAPVDIVVNGQLIARGDVVVVDDNFGVRITEIVGTKELMDSLDNS